MTAIDSSLARTATQPASAAAPVVLPNASSVATAVLPANRTIWGMDPVQLHSRYWASHGVQVVRQGEPSEIVRHAELYLLTDPGSLTLFKLSPLMDVLNWIKPNVLFVRLHDSRERAYREHAVTDDSGRFVRFERVYDGARSMTRVVLTPDREVAQLWQSAPTPRQGWRRLRRHAKRAGDATRSIDGTVYDRIDPRDLAYFIHDLVDVWRRPDSTILRLRHLPEFGNGVWRDAQANVLPGAKFIGPVWVGAGRTVSAGVTVVGPAVIWDDPQRRPANDAIQWLQIEPREPPADPNLKDAGPLDLAAKRLFDIAFSLFGILCSLPLYPFIMLAIWIEDGRPFLFGHLRETLGAREFKCWKFRSMGKDAEKLKAQLKARNQADGPQFFIENDPRLTRIGRLLRRYNLDELPQFWNVLRGDMSIVGPRPSPRNENQFCPAWREARLSVRPGITGLWQVKGTRKAGNDFQEWIKFDIEYVERRTFWLDLVIIFKTAANVFRKLSRS